MESVYPNEPSVYPNTPSVYPNVPSVYPNSGGNTRPLLPARGQKAPDFLALYSVSQASNGRPVERDEGRAAARR